MTEIRKYSKEWLVDNGTNKQKKAVKNADYSRLILKDGVKPEDVKLNAEFYQGTKAEVVQRYQAAHAQGKNGNECVVASVSGGISNFFDMLDEDGDGTVTEVEVKAFAAVDTEEFADESDGAFSIRDLQQVYENVTTSSGAKHITSGNVDLYMYKDGTETTIIKNDRGEVQKKVVTTEKNKENYETKYDYSTKIKTDTITDAQGRVRYENIDAQGRVNDKTITTTYDSQGRTKTVRTETAGRYINEDYNWETQKKTIKTTLKYHTDGVIGDTKQQSIGDCWILSGMNALRDTTKGAQAIKDAIKKNPDGSVTVTLKGVNKSYRFTPDEIGAHDYTDLGKEYSSGDVDMNLIEMAITRYRKEIVPADEAQRTGKLKEASPEDPIKGGFLEEAIQYITGVSSKGGSDESTVKKLLKNKMKKEDRYVTTVQFKEKDTSVTSGKIVSKHAYQVKKVTEDTVYVVNPWDSSNEIAYPIDKFKANVSWISQADLK